MIVYISGIYGYISAARLVSVGEDLNLASVTSANLVWVLCCLMPDYGCEALCKNYSVLSDYCGLDDIILNLSYGISVSRRNNTCV